MRVVAAAGADLGDDGAGILLAGVVGGQDHMVGQRRGGRAHARPLAAVAVAAAAEHDAQPAGRDFAEGGQHVPQRVLRVGVIDEDLEPAARRDFLEAAGHGDLIRAELLPEAQHRGRRTAGESVGGEQQEEEGTK